MLIVCPTCGGAGEMQVPAGDTVTGTARCPSCGGLRVVPDTDSTYVYCYEESDYRRVR
jgi:DnaJ-class molecular chaperone